MTTPISGDATGIETAIAEAISESQFPVTDAPADVNDEFDATFGEDGTTDGEPSTAEPPSEDSDPPEAGDAGTDEVPDSYWGVDLTGIPVEQRRAVIAHLEQQDGTIRKLQAKLSEPLEASAPTPVEEAGEVSDEQLLAFYGVEAEDYTVPDVMKQALIKQGRNQLALEDQVARLTNVEQSRSYEAQWNRELDELEATYGNLPGSREEVLRYALREEVVTPADLYFKLTAPVKREVEGLAAKARREASKREQSAGVKPRANSAEPAPVQPGMSLRDAVKAAAQDAQKETGLSWKTAMKRVLTAKPEGSE